MLGEKLMAGEIITTQELEDAKVDAKDLGEAVNEDKVITPRYGDSYKSLPMAVREMMETGGWNAFTTETALLASTPTVTPSVAYAFDTKKLYLWEGSAWADEGLSQLDQAIAYVDANAFFRPIVLQGSYDIGDLPNGYAIITSDTVASTLVGLPTELTQPRRGYIFTFSGATTSYQRLVRDASTSIEVYERTGNGQKRTSPSFAWNDWVRAVSRTEITTMTTDINNVRHRVKGYNTKSEMDADLANVDEGQYAMVVNDLDGEEVPTADNGFYYKIDGAWESVAWNPVDQVFGKLFDWGVSNTPSTFSVTDSNNNIAILTSSQGRVFIPNLINQKLDVLHSSEQGFSVVDKDGNPLIFSANDRVFIPNLVNQKLDVLNSSEQGFSVVDRNGNPLIFTANDRVIIPSLITSQTNSNELDRFSDVIWIVVGYGQSNERGSGTTAVSTTQPYNNLKLNNSRMTDRPGDIGYVGTALIPLTESSVETNSSITVNELTRRLIKTGYIEQNIQFGAINGGNGGTRLENLSKGHADGWYARLIQAITDMHNLIIGSGKKSKPLAIHFNQGESDIGTGVTNFTDYKNLLLNFLADIQIDFSNITGYVFDGCIELNQTCATRSYVTSTSQFVYPHVPLAQLDLAKNHPQFVMSHPDYINDHVDHVHYTTAHATRSNAYRARALTEWTLGKKWLPLHIQKADWTDTHVDLTYHVPFGKLVIDTTTLAQTHNYGFDIWNESENVSYGYECDTTAITSVEILSTNQIRIYLNAPVSNGGLLTYAWGRIGDPFRETSADLCPRGNIRDTHGLVDTYTNPLDAQFELNNWAVLDMIKR